MWHVRPNVGHLRRVVTDWYARFFRVQDPVVVCAAELSKQATWLAFFKPRILSSVTHTADRMALELPTVTQLRGAACLDRLTLRISGTSRPERSRRCTGFTRLHQMDRVRGYLLLGLSVFVNFLNFFELVAYGGSEPRLRLLKLLVHLRLLQELPFLLIALSDDFVLFVAGLERLVPVVVLPPHIRVDRNTYF